MTEEMYVKIEDHEAEIKARQVWQYKDQEIFDKLLQAYAESRQEYEDILFQLLTERALSNAKGVTLDRLGEYYQVERNGLSDAVYRNIIITTLSRLQAAGQIEILLDALRITSQNPDVSLLQVFPAAILMTIFVTAFGETPAPAELNAIMQAVKAAGVKLDIAEQLQVSAFIFSDNVGGGNAGEGFSAFSSGDGGGAFPHILS